MLITIKNGSLANKETVFIPFSKLKNEIALCLKKEGFIESVSKKTKKGQPVLEIGLIYLNNKPKVTEVKRISKPSRRVYMGMRDIHTVKNGIGLLVLSTPKGILGGRDARKEQVGGEVLFKVW